MKKAQGQRYLLPYLRIAGKFTLILVL